MNDEVIATVGASELRRVMGVAMLAVVGATLIYVALSSPPTAAWLVFLLVIGIGALWIAVRMWQATTYTVELTEEVLRCTDGTIIARVSEIEVVDRGFFAFKPSNGFLIRTTQSAPRAWFPGLWWRSGRRIGIGGVTPGSQSKAMSEILAAMIVQRNAATRD